MESNGGLHKSWEHLDQLRNY